MSHKRYHRQNYYDILGVKQDCNQNDIKEAFIKLSKENHPDGDPHDKTRHSKFVLINEAYTALVRRQSRVLYDEALRNQKRGFHEPMRYQNAYQPNMHHRSWRMHPDFDSMRNSKQNEGFWERYYGIQGLKRLPNWSIAAACCICVALSTVAFICSTKKVAERRREAVLKTNAASMAVYNTVRKRARENTNEEQMIWLSDSLENNVKSMKSQSKFQ
ncbi:DnaJ sub C member 4 [Chamberlinius hualienensis]